jgi:hypothetical protein
MMANWIRGSEAGIELWIKSTLQTVSKDGVTNG